MSNPFKVGDRVFLHRKDWNDDGHFFPKGFLAKNGVLTVSVILNDHQVRLAEDIRTFHQAWNVSHLNLYVEPYDAFYDETPEIAEIRAQFINHGEVDAGS